MKTNMLLFFSYILIIFSVSFISCSDDEGDTTKPVINLIEPADGDTLHIGEDVHFEMNLSDDVMLKSYKIDVHNNFDSHGSHTKSFSGEPEGVPFSFERTYDVSGQKNKHVHHHDIVIPENAAEGQYHFVIYCTDAAGNEAIVAHDVVLSHEGGEHEGHGH